MTFNEKCWADKKIEAGAKERLERTRYRTNSFRSLDDLENKKRSILSPNGFVECERLSSFPTKLGTKKELFGEHRQLSNGRRVWLSKYLDHT